MTHGSKRKISRVFNVIKNSVKTLIFLNLIYVLILVLVAKIPQKKLEKNLLDYINSNGSFYNISSFGPLGIIEVDYYTECVGLGLMIDASNQNIFTRALAPRWLTKDNEAPCLSLKNDILKIKTDAAPSSYLRFWHGYLAFSKIALNFFPYSVVRILSCNFLVISYLIFGLGIFKSTRSSFLAVLLPSFFVFFSNWTDYAFIHTHSIPFGSCLMMFYWLVMSPLRENLLFQDALSNSLIAGSFYCFIDFMIGAPLSAVTTVFAFLLIAFQKKKHSKDTLKLLLSSSTGWCLGYTGTFILKMFITASLTNSSTVFSDFMNRLLFRLGVHDYPYVSSKFGVSSNAIIRNQDHYSLFLEPGGKTVQLFAGILLFYFVTMFRVYIKNKEKGRMLALAFIPAVIPFLWAEVFKNHTQIHAKLFSGRYVFLFPMVLTAAVFLVLRGDSKKIRPHLS